jgi:hypothetical protein
MLSSQEAEANGKYKMINEAFPKLQFLEKLP